MRTLQQAGWWLDFPQRKIISHSLLFLVWCRIYLYAVNLVFSQRKWSKRCWEKPSRRSWDRICAMRARRVFKQLRFRKGTRVQWWLGYSGSPENSLHWLIWCRLLEGGVSSQLPNFPIFWSSAVVALYWHYLYRSTRKRKQLLLLLLLRLLLHLRKTSIMKKQRLVVVVVVVVIIINVYRPLSRRVLPFRIRPPKTCILCEISSAAKLIAPCTPNSSCNSITSTALWNTVYCSRPAPHEQQEQRVLGAVSWLSQEIGTHRDARRRLGLLEGTCSDRGNCRTRCRHECRRKRLRGPVAVLHGNRSVVTTGALVHAVPGRFEWRQNTGASGPTRPGLGQSQGRFGLLRICRHKFKDEYRAALDALELTDAQITKLVAEANVAFLLNMRLFEELDVMANVPGACRRHSPTPTLLMAAITWQKKKKHRPPSAPLSSRTRRKARPKQTSVPLQIRVLRLPSKMNHAVVRLLPRSTTENVRGHLLSSTILWLRSKIGKRGQCSDYSYAMHGANYRAVPMPGNKTTTTTTMTTTTTTTTTTIFFELTYTTFLFYKARFDLGRRHGLY